MRVLTDAAITEYASDTLIQDVNTIFKNAGVKAQDFYSNSNNAKDIVHEYFAQAFEVYLSEGKAPVKELQSTFDRIKSWLIDIYHNAVNVLGVQINDDMREVFDRLLASPEMLAQKKALEDINTQFKASEAELTRLQQEIT